MDNHQEGGIDGSSEYSDMCIIYYTHHRNMHVLQYIFIQVSSDYMKQ
jgi:hypothetical protein